MGLNGGAIAFVTSGGARPGLDSPRVARGFAPLVTVRGLAADTRQQGEDDQQRTGRAPNELGQAVVADTALVVPLPPGFARYRVTRVTSFAPSLSLSAAQAAVYTATAAGGTAVCAAQPLSGLTTSTAGAAGNAIDLTLALAAATFFTATTLYFRIAVVQGAAATLDVILHIQPYD